MLDRIWPHDERHVTQWAGAAAIVYGVLFFLSNLFGEFLLPAERSSGEITRLGLFLVYVGAYGLGALALVPALRALDRVYRERGESTRAGSIGLRVTAVGAAVHALFAALYFATAAATGDAAGALFVFYALGFLLLIGGSVTTGMALVRSGARRPVGALLLVAAIAGVGAIVTPAPAHDAALFAFNAAWIALGLVLIGPARLNSRSRGGLRWSSAR